MASPQVQQQPQLGHRAAAQPTSPYNPRLPVATPPPEEQRQVDHISPAPTPLRFVSNLQRHPSQDQQHKVLTVQRGYGQGQLAWEAAQPALVSPGGRQFQEGVQGAATPSW